MTKPGMARLSETVARSVLHALFGLALFSQLLPLSSAATLCLQPASSDLYAYNFTIMIPYPKEDTSSSVLLADISGVIYSADLPPPKSSSRGLSNISIFLDLRDKLSYWPGPNIKGMAFHPAFPFQPRFFVSYICSTSKPGECNQITRSGIGPEPLCPCSQDPLKCHGYANCSNVLVVDEFRIQGETPDWRSRMLGIGLAFADRVGGEIMFRPGTSRMLISVGDGGAALQELNLPQNSSWPFGKILRIDVDAFPPVLSDIQSLGLIGEYSIPTFGNMNTSGIPGITFAQGIKSPKGCAFDPSNTKGILCSDIEREAQNLVISIVSRANYGWPRCPADGSFFFSSPKCSSPLVTFGSIGVPGDVTGGGHLVQLGLLGEPGDYCAHRWYVYNNGTSSFYAVKENITGSLAFPGQVQPINVSCSINSTACTSPSSFYSWMANGTAAQYVVADTGVYQVVDPLLCGVPCAPPPSPPPSPPYNGSAGGSPNGTSGGVSPGGSGGSPGAGGGSQGGSTSPSSGSGTPASTPSSGSDSSSGTTLSSGGGSSADVNSFLESSGIQGSFDSSYWIKLAIIFAIYTVLVGGICSFFVIMGWREGRKKDQQFLELKQAEAELDERSRGQNDDDDMVYHPAGDPEEDRGTVYTDEDGTEYSEDMSEGEESMSQYSSRHGPASSSGRSASTRGDRKRMGDGESDAGTDYTGYTGYTGYSGRTGQTGYSSRSGDRGGQGSFASRSRRDGMSDSQSYTTRDDWTETASGYGYAHGP